MFVNKVITFHHSSTTITYNVLHHNVISPKWKLRMRVAWHFPGFGIVWVVKMAIALKDQNVQL